MTIGDLLNWSGLGKTPAAPSIERYHSGPSGYWEHKSHGHGSWKSGGKGSGGNGAALSALTLLAFLFLINVMQQSLQENNSTVPTPTGATALLLRDGQQRVSLSTRTDADGTTAGRQREDSKTSNGRPKGDVRDFDDLERA